MSASLKGLPPQAIVLASVDAFALESSTAEGMMTFGVNLGDVRDTEDLTQAVATELMFPHEATGLDALLDLMSDLDWFGHDEGYVVQFDHLDELSQREPELLACFVALFPNLCDRWRSRGIPFLLVLRCQQATRDAVRRAIDAANIEMVKATAQPWLAEVSPAEVIECAE